MVIGQVLGLSVLGLAMFSSSSPAAAPISTTLCEIDAHPQEYDQKIVRVRARIEADSTYFIPGLFDERCLKGALHLAGDDKSADRKQTSSLDDVLLGVQDGIVGTKAKSVRATIVGRFSREETFGIQAHTLYPIAVTDTEVRYGEKSLIPSLPAKQ